LAAHDLPRAGLGKIGDELNGAWDLIGREFFAALKPGATADADSILDLLHRGGTSQIAPRRTNLADTTEYPTPGY
jgi:hypothetical protein